MIDKNLQGKKKFFAGIAMANRGRVTNDLVQVVTRIFSKYENGFIVFGESDNTDITKGLNGREVLYATQEKLLRNKNIRTNILASEDKEIGISVLYANSLSVESNSWEQINVDDLNKPMGSSERYKQHRIITTFNIHKGLSKTLGVEKVNLVAQHQSAFLHGYSRYKQAKAAMNILNNLDKNDNAKSISFLIRDQNTWMPFERTAENKLRKENNLVFPTDSLSITYRTEFIEEETGGLNKLGAIFMKSFLSGLIKKLFLYTPLETIGLPAYQAENYKIKTYSMVQGTMDHPINFIVLN